MYKKTILSVCFLALACFVPFASCNKSNEIIPPKEPSSNELPYTLSQEILDYDKTINAYDGSIPLGTMQTIIKYVVADAGTAWKAYKILAKIPGLIETGGYAAAFAFLAGVGGSIATYVTSNYDFRPIASNPGGISNLGELGSITPPLNYSYAQVGQLHNDYLDTMINAINNGRIDPSKNEEIDSFLLSKTNEVFETNIQMDYNEIEDLTNAGIGEMTPAEIYSAYIADGTPENIASYLKDFYTRVENPKVYTIDQAVNYANLFLDDVAQQDSFSQGEKDLISYSLSIFIYSSQYWSQHE